MSAEQLKISSRQLKVRERVVSTLAMVLAVALLLPAAQSAARRARTSSGCAAVTFIGAAGSGESTNPAVDGGVGAATYLVADSLQTDLKAVASWRLISIDYPAAPVETLLPSYIEAGLGAVGLDSAAGFAWYHDNLSKYLASINQGIADAVAAVKARIATCPNSLLVLAGYSQGAMVMHQAELQLSSANLSHIAGTILIADGDRTPWTAAAYQLGSSPARGEGIRIYWHAINKRDIALPASTVDICNTHDIVCDFTTGSLTEGGVGVHLSYANAANRPLLTKAAAWMADRIIATHPGLTSTGTSGAGGQTPASPNGSPNPTNTGTGATNNTSGGTPSPTILGSGQFTVMNATGGIYWRSGPDWNTAEATAGNGFYPGTVIQVSCYQSGAANVPGSTDSMWEQASWVSGPGTGHGWINEHFIDDGSAINEPSPGVPACSTPAPTPTPTPPAHEFSVMNATGGIYWRSGPDWNTAEAVSGNGFYPGTIISVSCYQSGAANVPGSTDSMWEQASWVSGPGTGHGWINEHFINDGSAINQPSPGVPHC